MVQAILQHSPAAIVQQLLIDLGLGSDPGDGSGLAPAAWPVYCAGEPDAPDEVITVYDTAWVDNGRSMVSGNRFQHYGFQVRIRSQTHRTGFLKATTIRDTLDQSVRQEQVSLDGHQYVVIAVSNGGVLVLGKDTPATKRNLFTINGKCPIRILS